MTIPIRRGNMIFSNIGKILEQLLIKYIESLVCQHFCKFKNAGSKLIYTHVHIYGENPNKITGVGHDDDTGISDPHHTTVSIGNECKFNDKVWEYKGKKIGGKMFFTAYFHQCDGSEKCPEGYTRIKCKCMDKRERIKEVWVCYTLDLVAFTRWHEEQKWKKRVGKYELPFINIRQPKKIPDSLDCGSSVILYKYAVKRVPSCTEYNKDNNPLIEKTRKELKRAADKIKCKGNCTKRTTEVFRGWRCKKVSSFYHAEAVVQWKVECKK